MLEPAWLWAGTRGRYSDPSPHTSLSSTGGPAKGKPCPAAPPLRSWTRPGRENGGNGWCPPHARTHTRGFVHAPRARPARPPSAATSLKSHAHWRWGRGRGVGLGGVLSSQTAVLIAFPTSLPSVSPGCPPRLGKGPVELRGAGSPRTQGPGRAPWAACIFHRTSPGALQGVRGETGCRQSHGPPRSPSPTRPSPTSFQPDLSHLPSSLALCETVPCLPIPTPRPTSP